MKVFVYGTLLRGMERAQFLTNSRYIGPAMIQAEVFDLVYFPGIKEGNGTVIGELYEIDQGTLDVLDEIEGYYEGNVEESLFVRKRVNAYKFSDGERVRVCCYFYNSLTLDDAIYHGDYRRYILERENEDQWIVAYGSNISRNRLVERIGEVKEYKKGFIDDFRLVFNKKAYKKQAVYANIAYAGPDERCPAVSYRLSPEQVSKLDLYEGVPNHYMRISILFCDNAGGKSVSQTYIAHPDRLVWGQSPEPDYFDHILRGYRELGFDISSLLSHGSLNRESYGE